MAPFELNPLPEFHLEVGQREMDYYGYIWDEPQEITALSYNNGVPNEYCGWFTTFDVEYLVGENWVKIEDVQISPEMNSASCGYIRER